MGSVTGSRNTLRAFFVVEMKEAALPRPLCMKRTQALREEAVDPVQHFLTVDTEREVRAAAQRVQSERGHADDQVRGVRAEEDRPPPVPVAGSAEAGPIALRLQVESIVQRARQIDESRFSHQTHAK